MLIVPNMEAATKRIRIKPLDAVAESHAASSSSSSFCIIEGVQRFLPRHVLHVLHGRRLSKGMGRARDAGTSVSF